MKRFALMAALFLFSNFAHAWGLPYAVDTLEKAQSIAKKDSAKHLLVFYTSET